MPIDLKNPIEVPASEKKEYPWVGYTKSDVTVNPVNNRVTIILTPRPWGNTGWKAETLPQLVVNDATALAGTDAEFAQLFTAASAANLAMFEYIAKLRGVSK